MISHRIEEETADTKIVLRKFLSLILSIVFALVGLLFLLLSGEVLALFNRISYLLGIPRGPEQAAGFYLGLAISYMYLVSLIAFLMWRHPRDRMLPLLLINGKAASSILSAALFVYDRPLLIYGTNAIVDGTIAGALFMLYRNPEGRVQ